MQHWRIGKSTVTRIEELIGPLFDPEQFFPAYNKGIIDKHKGWLFPNHMHESGRIIASMHSWLIDTPSHKILVDSCIGNDKDRMPFRDWHNMKTPYPTNFAATGITPDQIDYVLCTHLHVDHVGWNTCLKDGQWVPTFPNAKYLFSRTEFEFWEQQRKQEDPDQFNAVNSKTFDDSVLPIMHLAELIEGEQDLIDGLLHISPAPGHTPGSITLSLIDSTSEALFTGDILHHPIQVYEPEWNSAYCELPDQAIATRKDVLSHCCNAGALMMPAHFGFGHAGHVIASESGFAFDFLEPDRN
jgi:glyoxylase-like metal-dependent hydrolase (beta-lactamase superfamily II)